MGWWPVSERSLARRRDTILPRAASRRAVRRATTAVALAAVLGLGAVLRFVGLNWDEGHWIHPDEGHMRIILSVVRMPDHPSQYFDTHQSPLNSLNQGYDYSYGTLPLFTTRAVAEWLDRSCNQPKSNAGKVVATLLAAEDVPSVAVCGEGDFVGSKSALVGRLLSGLADLGTLAVMYLLGRRLYGEGVGLLSAALGAVAVLMIQQAHFFTVDSASVFFVALTGYCSVRAGQSGHWLAFGAAGVCSGLAAACKISAGLSVGLVLLGGVWRYLSAASEDQRSLHWQPVFGVALAALLSITAFRVAQPYAFEGPGFLGLRLNPDWLGRLTQIRAEQNGEWDLPPGVQWTDRAPLLFPLVNMVVWGMGLPLGSAMLAGWAVAGVQLMRRHRLQHLVIWTWATGLFLYLGTRWVKTNRYFIMLYPFLIVMAASFLMQCCRSRRRALRLLGLALTAIVVLGTTLWAGAFVCVYARPHTRLAASRWIYANIPQGATLANEHWDWGVPIPLDGYDAFGSMYRGFEMEHYREDTEEKREDLYSWLQRADYVCIASNRLYASIPRLEARYPLTTAYYGALFSGQLGFDLVADFTSAPSLGPFQFPDQELPFSLIEAPYVSQTSPIRVVLPPAEEAFSVYDHPRVLIFRKTEAFSLARVEEVLGNVDVSGALLGLKPVQATAARALLHEDPQIQQEQQGGGTWSDLFDSRSPLSRSPLVGAVVWWLVAGFLGLMAFPVLFSTLPRLADRGYGISRVLGLLLVAYGTWLAASLHLLPNTRTTIVRMVLLLALVGVGLGWLRRGELLAFARSRKRYVLVIEGLAGVLYAGWIGVRLLQPDLWHPIVGGEKPMDFAYFNAVMKSTWFPPYNPWFAGTSINYYYFGFVLVGTLTKLTRVVPAVAYNLAVPLVFSLTGTGAFSVAYNLFGGHDRGRYTAGAAAVASSLLLGNLGVVKLIRDALMLLGGEPIGSTMPGLSGCLSLLQGAWEVLARGAELPLRIESWYWNPTRIIPAAPGEIGPITEFPAFTFLYGDLHAHMLAFPAVLLVLAVAANWARTARPKPGSVAIAALGLGSVYATNTWDYPTFLGVAGAGLAFGVWQGRGAGGRRPWGLIGGGFGALGLLSILLFLPYHAKYAAGYQSFGLWRGSRTPLSVFLWIYGILLFPVLSRVLLEAYRSRRMVRRWQAACVGVGVAIAGLGLLLSGYSVAMLVVPISVLAVFLVVLPGMPSERRLLWLMLLVAMGVCLLVEVFVLQGDLGRMNTVFKFYLQVWVLLSIIAGVSVAWVRGHAERWRPWARCAWWVVMGGLALGGGLFLPLGVRARAVDRITAETGRTIDGMAFMRHASVYDGVPEEGPTEIPLAGDYAAIRWLQENVKGSPVILEGLGYREYLWANRVSVYTGLPSVVGWRWHQVQQRAALPASDVEKRYADVRDAYSSISVRRARQVFSTYSVRYVYVGQYERAYYDPSGLRKFDDMVAGGLLSVAYEAGGVTIYQVL